MGQLLHDRYLVGKVLGEGGFGITYLGLDTTLERRVAIKEYFPNVFVHRESSVSLDVTCYSGEKQAFYEKGREQFLQEARVLARFDAYPEIVQVLDFFPANNTAYIVMELLIGNTLRTVLAQQERIPAKYLFEIMEPVLRTMNAMHGAGIIHRDISPDNFMLLDDGQLKLLDFGCARDVDKEHTLTVMLKHGYAPIEQYTGYNQGPWTDVYALSATLYHCLTGRTPPRALERMTAQDPLIPPNRLGAALTPEREQALIRGLAVEPKNRWQSIAGLYAALYQTVIKEYPWLPKNSETELLLESEPAQGTMPIFSNLSSKAEPGPGRESEPEPEPRSESAPVLEPEHEPNPKKKSILHQLAQKKGLLVGIAACFLLLLIIFADSGKNASSAGRPPSFMTSEQDKGDLWNTRDSQDTDEPQNTTEPQSSPAPAAGSISLSQSFLTLTKEDSVSITANMSPSGQAVTWSSSNTSVATLSGGQDHLSYITAVGAGTTTITASMTYNGKVYSDSCTVTVVEAEAVGISLSESILTLTQGDSDAIIARVLPNMWSGPKVDWSSSSTSVATLSDIQSSLVLADVKIASIRITAVGAGTTTITASMTYDGKVYSDSCTVTVLESTEEPAG